MSENAYVIIRERNCTSYLGAIFPLAEFTRFLILHLSVKLILQDHNCCPHPCKPHMFFRDFNYLLSSCGETNCINIFSYSLFARDTENRSGQNQPRVCHLKYP